MPVTARLAATISAPSTVPGSERVSRLPGALVEHAEFVTRPEIVVEIELPPKDVCQLRDDARRRSGVDHVLAQTVLDTPGGTLHLGEVREPGARGVDPLRRALEDEERAVVDLVAQRVERARRAIEAQGEPAPRMEAMEVVDGCRGRESGTGFRVSDAVSREER